MVVLGKRNPEAVRKAKTLLFATRNASNTLFEQWDALGQRLPESLLQRTHSLSPGARRGAIHELLKSVVNDLGKAAPF